MKSLVLILAAVMLFPPYLRAQEEENSDPLANELAQEIDALYPTTKIKKKKVSRRAPVQRIEKREIVTSQEIYPDGTTSQAPRAAAPVESVQSSDDVFSPTSSSVEAQPSSVVEDRPLKANRLDDLKRNRLEKERQNEERLIEKLEMKRMKDEETYSGLDPFGKKNTEAGVDPNAVAPVNSVVQPSNQQYLDKTPVQELEPEPTIQVIAGKDLGEDPFGEDKPIKYYVTALAGIGSYGSVQNVQGVYSMGAGFGVDFPEGLILEGDFIYSSYDLQSYNNSPMMPGYNYPTTLEMNQSLLAGIAKYQFPTKRFRPVVGALVAYSYRTFRDRFFASSQTLPTSNAFDAGFLIGANVEVSKRFTIGTDLKYMMNMTYRRDAVNPYTYGGMYNQNLVPGSKPVEEIAYYLFSVNGAFSF